MKEIVKTVCKHLKVWEGKVYSESRYAPERNARQIAMYLIRKNTGYTLHQIGEHFNREHSLVVHSVKTVENQIATNKQFKTTIDELMWKCKHVYIPMNTKGMFCKPVPFTIRRVA